ncbi:translation initiation factor IF-2-like [Serinus canaria]|uniref:translation initiation factor IF-2-like n=1 Tax=Serinus canaria TaxID=9135 RepID=UPI0021CD1852|nr:translation initiation factor IF-2-like [Serinus canaria]
MRRDPPQQLAPHRTAPPRGGALRHPSAIGCLHRPAPRAGQWAAAPPREAGRGRSAERRRCPHGARRGGGRARPVLCGPGRAPAAAGRRGLQGALVPLASVFLSAVPEDRIFPLRKNVPAGPGDGSARAEGERRHTAAPAAGRPTAASLQPSRLPAPAQPCRGTANPTRPAPDLAPAAEACAAPYLRLGEAPSAGAAHRSRCSGRLRAAGGAGPAVTWTPASPPAPARRASSLPAVALLDADLGLLITRHPSGSAAAAGSPRTSISDARQPGKHRRVLVWIDCYCFPALPFSGCPTTPPKVGAPQALSPGGSPARRSGSSVGQRAGGRCGRLRAAGRAAWARRSSRGGSVSPPAAAWGPGMRVPGRRAPSASPRRALCRGRAQRSGSSCWVGGTSGEGAAAGGPGAGGG